MSDAEKSGADLREMTFNVNFTAVGPEFQAVWILKGKDGSYGRLTTGGHLLRTRSRRLATRFDSKLWADTVAVAFEDARVVRLFSKAEREAKKMAATGASVWSWKPKEAAEPSVQTSGPVTTAAHPPPKSYADELEVGPVPGCPHEPKHYSGGACALASQATGEDPKR